MPKQDCPSTEQLRAYLLGRLQVVQIDEVAQHVEHCPPCEDTVATLEQEGDTFLAGLRGQRRSKYAGDDDYQRALAFVKNIDREASRARSVAHASVEDPAQPIGRLREYELLEILGEGGMGTVYKARHNKLDKFVAIKVLPPDRMKDTQAVTRFEREMRAVGKLEHPNIVRAMDAGEVEGVHFLVMEYVNGRDLSQLVKQHGPLPVTEACELIRQAALGLQEAHEHGMVHRDIKPSNLMLAARRNKPPLVKILDMGLALLDASPQRRELTSTGQMMGTLNYMAPEQGMDSHEVDIRADVYSLGATLYKLLCGEAPFSTQEYNSPIKLLTALAHEVPPSVTTKRAGLPKQLAEIVDRMLARSPADRFNTPREVACALLPFAEGADLAALLDAAGDATPVVDESTSGTDGGAPADVETAPTVEVAAPASQRESKSQIKEQPQSSAASVTPAAKPTPSRHFPRSMRWVIAVAAALASVLLLGVIFTFQFAKATVVVESPDGRLPDDVKIVLKGDGEPIEITADKKWTIVASPGDYRVQVEGGSDQFSFADGKITVSRFGKNRLTISRKPVDAGKAEIHAATKRQSPRAVSVAAQMHSLAMGEPAFENERREFKLAEPCPSFILAGGGRYILFHAKAADRLDALDVLAGKITHQIPNVPDDALIAASAETLLIVLPAAKLVQRYSLRTFEREKVALLPGSGIARVALMGPAGDGPLLVAGDDAQLIDVKTLKALDFGRPPIGRHDRYGFVGRVSADGKTFTGIPAGIGAVSYALMRVKDDRLSFGSFGSTSHAIRWAEPTADGSLFLVPGGIYSAQLAPLPVQELEGSRISATIDQRYFTAARFAKNNSGGEAVQLSICTTADRRVVHVETGFEELALTGNTNSRMSISNRLLQDAQSHIHYIPWAGLIVTIGYDDATVTLRKFDLLAALKRTGRDYLFVDSLPPVRVKRGESLTYRISVEAARAGTKFKLETGPEGMTVLKSGQVNWKVPADFAADSAVAAISIRDKAGNEILHAFEVAVE